MAYQTAYPSASSNLLNNAHNFISIKLTRTNYLLWRTQISLFLEGNNLMDHVEGTHNRGHPTDPRYNDLWRQQDELIKSLLIASLSEDVFPKVIDLQTSRDIWTTLQQAFQGEENTMALSNNVRKIVDTQLIVATLIATVTFAAGFTVPGGTYDNDNDGPNQGMAILARKAAFQAFIVSDTIAVMSSIAAVFLHFVASMYLGEDQKAAKRYVYASLLTIIAMIAMTLAFITGLYTVLAHSSLGLAITICVFGSFCILIFLGVFYRLIRYYWKLLSPPRKEINNYG